jgi:cell wall assembly regulator SMI1
MGMHSWKSQWSALERLLKAAGATGRWEAGLEKPPRFEVDEPATEKEIQKIESELGTRIPESFRQVLREFSARVCIEWALPQAVQPPERFREIFAGECRWDLNALPSLQKTHREWIKKCFTARSTPDWPDKESDTTMIEYDLVWHNKFPFLEVGNGDMLGIDTTRERSGPVIYLSHEDGACHGFVVGNDFEDYVDRLTALAFVGSEDWQLEPFLTDPISGLRTPGDTYDAWRHWLRSIATNRERSPSAH